MSEQQTKHTTSASIMAGYLGTDMTSRQQLSLGAALAVFGGIGTVLAPVTGVTELANAWSFFAGFLIGICAGSGSALSVFGLLRRRREASGR